MNKHFIAILSVVLVLAVIGAVVYIALSGMKSDQNQTSLNSENSLSSATENNIETVTGEIYKVGIVQHGLGNASKDCYEGFVDELGELNRLGNVEIIYVVEDDEELCKAKIQELVDDGCSLLYTIGRFASEAAAEITQDVPIVFGAVNSPDEVGLVENNEIPGGNVTGVSSYTPCFEQIELIPMLLPDAKIVAGIYSNTDEDSVTQSIIAAKEADSVGLKYTSYPVDSKDSLTEALEKIKGADTEVIYIPVDRFLSSNMATIVEFSFENKVPIICGDEETLNFGAFATSEINYNSIGRKAAGMASDILFEKQDVSTIPVNYKHDCTNIVNKNVKDKLGIEIPATSLGEIDIREYVIPTQAEETKAED